MFKIDDVVKVLDTATTPVLCRNKVTKIIDVDYSDPALPYLTDLGWFKQTEVERVEPNDFSGINPQELADFLAQYNSHSDDLVREVSEYFDLPEPTPKTVKFVEVTLRIPQGEVHGFDSALATGIQHIHAHRNDLQNMIHNVELIEIKEES